MKNIAHLLRDFIFQRNHYLDQKYPYYFNFPSLSSYFKMCTDTQQFYPHIQPTQSIQTPLQYPIQYITTIGRDNSIEKYCNFLVKLNIYCNNITLSNIYCNILKYCNNYCNILFCSNIYCNILKYCNIYCNILFCSNNCNISYKTLYCYSIL